MEQDKLKKTDISATFLLSGQNLPSTVTVCWETINVFKNSHLSNWGKQQVHVLCERTQGKFWSHRAETTQVPHYLYERVLKLLQFLNKYAAHISFF